LVATTLALKNGMDNCLLASKLRRPLLDFMANEALLL